MGVLSSFHPAVRNWFEGRFPEGPSPPQVSGWPAIARREDTLIAAPTGSGKTLAAFLVCIDDFYQRSLKSAGAGAGAGAESDADAPFSLDPMPAAAASGAKAAGSPARSAQAVERPPGIEVLYISPLKALASDIQQNLKTPLDEIASVARGLGLPVPEIRVSMRSGDTSQSERAKMLRKPPQILVTTPESLYLLLTSARGREILRPVRTVIVDEIHALARDKRGSHLALSMERLEALCDEKPTRVGLSATQRPIELVAKLLVGVGPDRTDESGATRCTIVNEGHKRELDLETVLPGSDLEAVASTEQMSDVLDRIAEQVKLHRTTLVFVNTRRMAERLAHQLAERLGEDGVAAHHGSLSKERRLRVETALRAGQLRALVATASLELGIDVGPVELVCQIGSPRSIATFLQRVGRSGHFRGGTPKGRIYPLTRDELVECAGLLRGVRQGRLDRVLPPVEPLDILAQQIVAACAAEPWKEEGLYQLMRRAAPYEGLTRERFDEVVELVSEGIETGRGRRAAYIHRDQIGGQLRARRGARLAALTNGGAIPDVADYRVIADPDETFIGTVGEDFAIDSMPGDVFLLGSSTWRVRRVEAGKLRVVDAKGDRPSVPHWAGEAPARTEELSDEVSMLREELEPILADADEAGACRWLEEECGIGADASLQVARYLGVSRAALGGLPTRDRLVLERFFDDAGGMQLVIHSPRGGRLNRGLCLALRKKFCKNFNFELQAAANDDAMVLSLGPHHSFPLADVPRFLKTHGIEETLCQAVLPTPLFTARWRWNLNRSLAVLRFRGGKKNPPAIQRMESDDLMAAVFPQAAACQENIAGPVEIPDHPLVRQTMHDCLTDAMDAAGLKQLIERMEDGSLEILCVDTTEPSPLSHEILNGKPFTFLDDAPLEERRTRAVRVRRGLPVEERDLSRLDEAAIAKVREQAAPSPRDREELHDVLLGVGLLRADSSADARWSSFFRELEATGRAFSIEVGSAAADPPLAGRFWAATERADWVAALHPAAMKRAVGSAANAADSTNLPDSPDSLDSHDVELAEPMGEDVAVAHALKGHLETTGPISARELAARLGVRTGLVEIGLAALEAEGFVLRGRFDPGPLVSSGVADAVVNEVADAGANGVADADAGSGLQSSGDLPEEQFCARRLLARIHGDSQTKLRASVEPVSAQELLRFLFEWQHVAPGSQLEGAPALARIVEQLQGFDLAAGAWESEVLPARLRNYGPEWLDPYCLSGQVSWLRVAPPVAKGAVSLKRRLGQKLGPRGAKQDAKQDISKGLAGRERTGGKAGTSRSTPLSLVLRADLPWLLQAHRPEGREAREAREVREAEAVQDGANVLAKGARLSEQVLAMLDARGALFHSELVAGLKAEPVEVEAALWELVAQGQVAADGFQALRSLLGSRTKEKKVRAGLRARRGLRRGLAAGMLSGAEGRWFRLEEREAVEDQDGLAEAIAEQLLVRWGIVFRDVVARENLALPWREIVWALRRMEARGVVRGGRFVGGFTGEQFAMPEALDVLAAVRRKPRTGVRIRVSGSDPLNLVGILTPGDRIPAVRTREVVYVDGMPEALAETSSATDFAPDALAEKAASLAPAAPLVATVAKAAKVAKDAQGEVVGSLL